MTAQNQIVFCGRTSDAEMQNYNIPGKKYLYYSKLSRLQTYINIAIPACLFNERISCA